MADEITVDLDSDATVNYDDHARTYRGFIKLSQWATGFVIVVLILLAYFLI